MPHSISHKKSISLTTRVNPTLRRVFFSGSADGRKLGEHESIVDLLDDAGKGSYTCTGTKLEGPMLLTKGSEKVHGTFQRSGYSQRFVADDGTVYVGKGLGLFFALNKALPGFEKVETTARGDCVFSESVALAKAFGFGTPTMSSVVPSTVTTKQEEVKKEEPVESDEESIGPVNMFDNSDSDSD